MGRILALDYGEARIGVAISDSQGLFAQMLEPPIPNRPNAFKQIKRLVEDYQVNKVLIGEPRSLSGKAGKAAAQARAFANRLRKILRKPVELVDERFSTSRAHQLLRELEVDRQKSKLLIDNAAAYVLLQAYLDRAR